jgi:hypothetical protein
MEVCLSVNDVVGCLRWLGISQLVDTIQLFIWVVFLWRLLYLIKIVPR